MKKELPTTLITGSCGTIGSALVEYLRTNKLAGKIICMDNNENNVFMQDQKYINDSSTQVLLGDVRDLDRLKHVMQQVDIVYHTAALKHVYINELSPMEAVSSNISGVSNIIAAAKDNKIKKVIFTSSDKAVNPTNVMGTTKLMGERLISAANLNNPGKTIFISTRFGNVLGSSGSVITVFKQQLQYGQDITLTDERMTRFVMSIEQAVELVVNSARIGKGGEVFVTKMPVISIKDLAEVMLKEHINNKSTNKPKIKIIGSKPGEKLYEELMSEEEMNRSVELKNYFSVLPAFRELYKDIKYVYKNKISDKVTQPYVSSKSKKLNKEEIRSFLTNYNLL